MLGVGAVQLPCSGVCVREYGMGVHEEGVWGFMRNVWEAHGEGVWEACVVCLGRLQSSWAMQVSLTHFCFVASLGQSFLD